MAIPSVPHSSYQEFRDAVIGRGFDLDGLHGYQCWDGVDLLYQQSDVGQYLYTAYNIDPTLNGYAKTCWSYEPAKNRNGSGHFTKIYDKTEIKRGDILVFDTLNGWYGTAGHICFADEDYNGTNTIAGLGQNQGSGSNPNTGTPFNINNQNLSAFLGAFRYDGWQQPVPPTPTTTKKKHFPYPVAWNHWGWGM